MYVRYEEIIFVDNDKEMDYRFYNDIKYSFRYFDITINKLLSNKLYSLLDDYLQIYFNVITKEDKLNLSKYWYINKFDLDETDTLNLLQYKQLGFNNFKLLYENFKEKFLHHYDHSLILIAAATSGNFETYSFLKNEYTAKGHLFKKISNDNLQIQLSHGNKLMVLDSGGNMDIFIDLFKQYKSFLETSPFGVAFLIIWLIEHKQTEQCIIVIKELKKTPLIFHNLNFELVLMGLSLSNSDFKLAKFLVEEMNILTIFKNILSWFKNDEIKVNLLKRVVISNQTKGVERAYSDLEEIDYQVFNYYCSQFDQETKLINQVPIINILKGQTIKLLNFTFQSCNFNNEIIKNELIKGKYKPTFMEFQYLVDDYKNNSPNPLQSLLGIAGANCLNRIVISITNELFDLEYLKLFLKTISSSIFKDLKLPGECTDTKFEMVEFIFTNYRGYLPSNDNYKNKNSFFNDIRTPKFYFFVLSRIFQNSNLYNFENGVLSSAIKNSHFEIVQFLMTINHSEIVEKLDWDKLIDLKNHDSFKIFKFLNSHINKTKFSLEKSKNIYVNELALGLSKKDLSIRENYLKQILKIQDSKFFHYILSNMKFTILNSFNQNYKYLYGNFKNPDLMLVKFILPKRDAIKLLFERVSLEAIVFDSKFSILEYCIQNKYKPSFHIFTRINNPKKIITSLFLSKQNRLLYLIENDKDFIYYNFVLIKKLIIESRDTAIVNSILSSNSFNQDFKLKLFISMFITILSEFSSYYRDEFWFFNINFTNKIIETKDIEQFNHWPSKKRLSSIYYFYNKYLKPNQSLIKANQNVMFIIQSFLESHQKKNL